MATLAANNLTLADVAKGIDPQGKPAVVAELLNQNNSVIQDVPWVEGNLLTGHQYTLRTSLPSVGTRSPNEGVSPSKSTKAQAQEVCTIFEDWVTIDEIVAELGGNVNANRMNEATAHAEAMGQAFAQMLMYGNHATTPKDFTGIITRYASTSATNGDNIVLGGGSDTDNSSIVLAGWGKGKVYGIYPKGSQAGIVHKDWGKQIVTNAAGVDGSMLAAYREQWQWQAGLAVEDWRYIVRIPNIDISALVSKSSAADLFDKMIMALHRIPNSENVRLVFYMNRTVFQMLDIQQRDDVIAGGGLRWEQVDGKPVVSFRNAQVKIVDRLLENESLVS